MSVPGRPGGNGGSPADHPSDPPATGVEIAPSTNSGRPRGRRWWIYEIIAVVIVVVVVVVAYTATSGFGKSSGTTSSYVLIPKNTLDSIPAQQFDAVQLAVSEASIVTGSFYNSHEVFVYVMTPTDFHTLTVKDTVQGYNWTSGAVQGNGIYTVDVSIDVGPWDLVFYNPSTINTTALAFYSALTLTAS
jgi:hypothetical protein